MQEHLRQGAVADRVGEAQIDRQSDGVGAERRGFLQAHRHWRQGHRRSTYIVPPSAPHRSPRDDHRFVDLAVTAVQHVMGVGQGRVAMRAGGGFRDHGLVLITDQRAAAAFTAKAALARSDALGFLRLVPLLAPPRRQAGIFWGFARSGEPRFKFGNASLGHIKLPQRPDQGVFLGVAQVEELGKLGHPTVRINSAATAQAPFQADRCKGGLSRDVAPDRGMRSYRRENRPSTNPRGCGHGLWGFRVLPGRCVF